MDYEFAKQLRDARFPGSENWYDDGKTIWGGTDTEPPAPTLPELIDALGEKFSYLTKMPGYWRVRISTFDVDDETSGYETDDYDAVTMEDAAAKAWLALNSKGV